MDYRHRKSLFQNRIVIGHPCAAPDGLVQVVHGDHTYRMIHHIVVQVLLKYDILFVNPRCAASKVFPYVSLTVSIPHGKERDKPENKV